MFNGENKDGVAVTCNEASPVKSNVALPVIVAPEECRVRLDQGSSPQREHTIMPFSRGSGKDDELAGRVARRLKIAVSPGREARISPPTGKVGGILKVGATGSRYLMTGHNLFAAGVVLP